jgi:hypothetical protein
MKKFFSIMFLFALQISSAANLPATTNADNVSGQSGFKPVAGIHYRDIKQTVAVSNDTIIFLWYGCNSCFQLELQYAANNPNWQRLPVSLYKSWRPQTKLFYTMRSLNLEPSSDLKLMSAIADGSVASNDLAAQKKTILSPPIAAADIRHPLKELDLNMLDWASSEGLEVHLLLSKADKLKKGAQQKSLLGVKKILKLRYPEQDLIVTQIFSSLKNIGVPELQKRLDSWFSQE